jgi:hypothetical protein
LPSLSLGFLALLFRLLSIAFAEPVPVAFAIDVFGGVSFKLDIKFPDESLLFENELFEEVSFKTKYNI